MKKEPESKTDRSRHASLIYIIFPEGADGFKYVINKREVTFGRNTTCEVRIQKTNVSAKHALLTVDDDGLIWLKNLNDSTKTYLNGKEIHDTAFVGHNNVFAIGQNWFRLEYCPEIAEAFSHTNIRKRVQSSAALTDITAQSQQSLASNALAFSEKEGLPKDDSAAKETKMDIVSDIENQKASEDATETVANDELVENITCPSPEPKKKRKSEVPLPASTRKTPKKTPRTSVRPARRSNIAKNQDVPPVSTPKVSAANEPKTPSYLSPVIGKTKKLFSVRSSARAAMRRTSLASATPTAVRQRNILKEAIAESQPDIIASSQEPDVQVETAPVLVTEGEAVDQPQAEDKTVDQSQAKCNQPQAEGKAIDEPQAEGRTVDQSQAEGEAVEQPQAEGKTVDQSQSECNQPQAEAKAVDEPQAEGKAVDQPQAEGRTVDQSQAEGKAVDQPQSPVGPKSAVPQTPSKHNVRVLLSPNRLPTSVRKSLKRRLQHTPRRQLLQEFTSTQSEAANRLSELTQQPKGSHNGVCLTEIQEEDGHVEAPATEAIIPGSPCKEQIVTISSVVDQMETEVAVVNNGSTDAADQNTDLNNQPDSAMETVENTDHLLATNDSICLPSPIVEVAVPDNQSNPEVQEQSATDNVMEQSQFQCTNDESVVIASATLGPVVNQDVVVVNETVSDVALEITGPDDGTSLQSEPAVVDHADTENPDSVDDGIGTGKPAEIVTANESDASPSGPDTRFVSAECLIMTDSLVKVNEMGHAESLPSVGNEQASGNVTETEPAQIMVNELAGAPIAPIVDSVAAVTTGLDLDVTQEPVQTKFVSDSAIPAEPVEPELQSTDPNLLVSRQEICVSVLDPSDIVQSECAPSTEERAEADTTKNAIVVSESILDIAISEEARLEVVAPADIASDNLATHSICAADAVQHSNVSENQPTIISEAVLEIQLDTVSEPVFVDGNNDQSMDGANTADVNDMVVSYTNTAPLSAEPVDEVMYPKLDPAGLKGIGSADNQNSSKSKIAEKKVEDELLASDASLKVVDLQSSRSTLHPQSADIDAMERDRFEDALDDMKTEIDATLNTVDLQNDNTIDDLRTVEPDATDLTPTDAKNDDFSVAKAENSCPGKSDGMDVSEDRPDSNVPAHSVGTDLRCQGQTKTGTRCKNKAKYGNFCRVHKI